jgi:hypothetical protein
MNRVPKPLAWTFAGIVLVLIAVATLLPAGARYAVDTWACIVCGERGLADALANVVLFAPLGASVALAGVPWRRATLVAGALLSCLIELTQFGIPGRDPSIGDVLSNTAGVAGGVLLVVTAGQWLRPAPARARILACVWTAGAAGVAWATVLLLQPSFPKSIYYNQWTPDLGHLEWYRGRVHGAWVGSLPLPVGRAADSDRLRAELERHGPIIVRATGGPPVPALASLFSIYDDQQREVLLVGPDRDDLVYRFRSRANALRLDSPDLRARGLLRGIRPGDSLNVGVSWEGRDACLSANGRHACGRSTGASAGWSLLFYSGHFPAWLVALLNGVWAVALAAPTAYWSPGKRSLAALGGILVLTVLGASAYGGAPSTSDAVLIAVGLGIGALAAMALRGRSQLTGPQPD